MVKAKTEAPYMTLAEAAASLGVSHKTLTAQAARGRLKAEKVGPLWLTTTSEVERYRRDSKGRPGRKSVGEP